MMIYLIGFLAILFFRVYQAGSYDFSSISYTGKRLEYDFDMMFGYAFRSVLIALTWVVSIPIYGVFLLGKRNKR